MRLTIPKIGTPYSNASGTWQVMRWLIPLSIATIALLVFLYPPQTFGSDLVVADPLDNCGTEFQLGHVCESELFIASQFFVFSMIPTIFLYRLTIAIGERWWTKKPIHGAIAAVVTLALLPPSIDYLLVKRTLNNLEFVSSIPDLRGKTVLLDQPRRYQFECAEYCLRLLYGSKVQSVIVSQQSSENLTKGEKVAVSFRLSRPPICTYDAIPRTTSYSEDGETVDNAAVQAALGNCIVSSAANIDQAEYILKLEIETPSYYRNTHPKFRKSIGTYGINHARLSALEKVTETKPDRLLQVGSSMSIHVMQYPTAPILWDKTWFSSHVFFTDHEFGASPLQNKFGSVGFHLAGPEDIGFARTEELLIDTINNKERRIYEQDRWWIRNYLSEIAKEKLDTKRIDIISKMISDPRFDSSDLYLFIRVVPKIGNERLVDALINRIRSYPATGQDRKDRQQDIKTYSSLIMLDSKKATWSRILPDVRKITRDKTMMVYASPLMRAYGAGNSKDAEGLLTIYQRLIREHALDDAPSIRARPEYQRYKERRRTRSEEIQAILTGLCALADKSEKILPTIKASAADNHPSMGGIGYQIWKTMVKFDVDVEQMGRELQVNSESLNRIRSTSQDVKLMQERNRDGISPKEEGYDSCVKAAA